MKKALPIIIGVIDALLLGVIVVSLLTGWRIGGRSPAVAPDTSSVSDSTKTDTPADTDDTDTDNTDKNTDVEPNDTESQDEDTIADPKPEDFDWISGLNSPPSDAVILESAGDVSGKWKAFIDYTDEAREYAILDITANGKTASVNWNISQIDYDGSGLKKGPDKVYLLEGTFDGGYIDVNSEIRGNLIIYSFYKLNSKSYALGTVINPSGLVGKVYLVKYYTEEGENDDTILFTVQRTA